MEPKPRPTRRDERRAQTVREIKDLAMHQVDEGGPEAVSLSGIVREMSMSPAAVYRYFASRDALLADLVIDAYDGLADTLDALDRGAVSADEHLDAVLRGTRDWAAGHPNSYRLIFQTSIGSGGSLAPDRIIPAASRSMAVLVDALAAVAVEGSDAVALRDSLDPFADSLAGPPTAGVGPLDDALNRAVGSWAERSDLTSYPSAVLSLAVLSWARLHGIVSLELGGHLGVTGIGADVVFDAEVRAIRSEARQLWAHAVERA